MAREGFPADADTDTSLARAPWGRNRDRQSSDNRSKSGPNAPNQPYRGPVLWKQEKWMKEGEMSTARYLGERKRESRREDRQLRHFRRNEKRRVAGGGSGRQGHGVYGGGNEEEFADLPNEGFFAQGSNREREKEV